MVVNGIANLGGTLDLSLINGFTPFNGEQFVILTSTHLAGVFSSVTGLHEGNFTFTVEYSPDGFANDVVLDVSVDNNAVPEPSSFVLLLCGFGVAVMVRRNRNVRCSV